MKKYGAFVVGLVVAVSAAWPACAHVVVKPKEVGIGERLNFTVSVPTEAATPTVQVRLIIPTGLKSVRPNVKPGWTITLKKAGESMKGAVLNTGEAAPNPEQVTEIIWSSGRIPAEQRDEFIFSAQAPSTTTTLTWLAYQTYGDGQVVAWDADPKIVEEFEKNNSTTDDQEDPAAPRPYSVTTVVNDLVSAPTSTINTTGTKDTTPLVISSIALLTALIALGLQLKKK